VSRYAELLGSEQSPYYPGSKQRKDEERPAPEDFRPDPFENVKPRTYMVKGESVEFFTVGQLAGALGREAVTMRKWERTGILPRATFQAPNPKKDQRARRRLYSRAQAEGIVRIADEEGLLRPLWDRPQIRQTRFTERVTELFKELL
jgi:hypothetical protein